MNEQLGANELEHALETAALWRESTHRLEARVRELEAALAWYADEANGDDERRHARAVLANLRGER